MKTDIFQSIKRWVIVLTIALAFFYAMDHFLMGAQGLPLNWNMSPGS